MSNWMLVITLGLQAHFAASFLVPLDTASQREFGGLLRWFWPWAEGDVGLLGRVGGGENAPLVALFLALGAGGLLLLAALAAAGWWVPSDWLRPLTIAGTVLLVGLMVLFLGPTRLLPLAVGLGTLYLALVHPSVLTVE